MRKKLNLTQTRLSGIKNSQLNEVKGGTQIIVGPLCGCGCLGPSSSTDNACANADGGLHTAAVAK